MLADDYLPVIWTVINKQERNQAIPLFLLESLE